MEQNSNMKVVKELPEQLQKATAKRIAKMNAFFKQKPKLKVFLNQEGYDQIIAQVHIPFMAMCEHHHVGFMGDISIAYIPGKWLLGLSKFARIAEYYLNPTVYTLQERGTQQIVNELEKALKPKGLMVVVRAKHGCAAYRGVKKDFLTITSAVKGTFATDLGARSEFLNLVHLNGKQN